MLAVSGQRDAVRRGRLELQHHVDGDVATSQVKILPVFYLSSALIFAISGGRTAGAARIAPAVCAATLLLLAFGGAWLP